MPLSAKPSLRKVPAFQHLPGLASSNRSTNPPSYPLCQPLPGERVPDESPLPPVSPLEFPCTLNRETEESIYRWILTIPDVEGNTSITTATMFQLSDKYGSAPSTPGGSPRLWTRPARKSSWAMVPRKFIFVVCGAIGIWMLHLIFSSQKHHVVRTQ